MTSLRFEPPAIHDIVGYGVRRKGSVNGAREAKACLEIFVIGGARKWDSAVDSRLARVAGLGSPGAIIKDTPEPHAFCGEYISCFSTWRSSDGIDITRRTKPFSSGL